MQNNSIGNNVFIDGVFSKEKSLCKIINIAKKLTNNRKTFKIEFLILYFFYIKD